MITANLTGNAGNNLSQYLICRVVAEHKGFEWGVNCNPTHDYHNGMNQLYFIDIDFGKKPEGIIHEFHEKWTLIDRYETINICTFDKRVYDIEDNTRLIGHNGAAGGLYQSEEYYIDRKEDIKQWLKIKPDYACEYELLLKENNIVLDDDTCVINFRGGEYRGIPNVLLKHEYWKMATDHMLLVNPKMKFVCITDDVEWATKYMPFEIPVLHIDIGFDYYTINNAKWLIISNSSFGLWAAWLNDKVKMTIAPKYWSQWNLSDGFWGLGDQFYRCFTYLDRDGLLSDYTTVKRQAIEYYKTHNLLPELYA